MKKVTPALYILMRTDMTSMNNGKSDAHSGHAASAFAKFYYGQHIEQLNRSKQAVHRDTAGMDAWHAATPQGFGTKLSMGVDAYSMYKIVENATKLGFAAEVVHDPEYPVTDGATQHLIPVDTCAYVFVPDKDDPIAKMILGGLGLKA